MVKLRFKPRLQGPHAFLTGMLPLNTSVACGTRVSCHGVSYLQSITPSQPQATTHLLFYHTSFTSLESHIIKSYSICLASFMQRNTFEIQPCFACINIHSFFLLRIIPQCGYTTICSFFLLLVNR